MNRSIVVQVFNDDGSEDEHELPAEWAICGRCQGNGKHVNPSIDGNGITSEEWHGPDWDDDSREAYLNGRFDVSCEANCTDGKVLIIASDVHLTPDQRVIKESYEKQEQDRLKGEAEDRHCYFLENGGRNE